MSSTLARYRSPASALTRPISSARLPNKPSQRYRYFTRPNLIIVNNFYFIARKHKPPVDARLSVCGAVRVRACRQVGSAFGSPPSQIHSASPQNKWSTLIHVAVGLPIGNVIHRFPVRSERIFACNWRLPARSFEHSARTNYVVYIIYIYGYIIIILQVLHAHFILHCTWLQCQLFAYHNLAQGWVFYYKCEPPLSLFPLLLLPLLLFLLLFFFLPARAATGVAAAAAVDTTPLLYGHCLFAGAYSYVRYVCIASAPSP